MLKVLTRYFDSPTLRNAQAVRSYERSHPFGRTILTFEQHEVLADAIHHANTGRQPYPGVNVDY